MMRKREEEELERYRLGERADRFEQLEATLVVLGDLDVDADSEAEDDGRAGAMGVARRDARRDGTVPLPPDAVTLRPLDASELGMAYACDAPRPAPLQRRHQILGQRRRGHPKRLRGPRRPGPSVPPRKFHPPWPRVRGRVPPALQPRPHPDSPYSKSTVSSP